MMATRYSNIGGRIQVYLGQGASRNPTAQELRAYQTNPGAFDLYGPGNRLISGPSFRPPSPAPAPVVAPVARPTTAPVAARPATVAAPVSGMNSLSTVNQPAPVPAPAFTPSTTPAMQSPYAFARPDSWYNSPLNQFSWQIPANYRTPTSYATPVAVSVPRLNLAPFQQIAPAQNLAVFPGITLGQPGMMSMAPMSRAMMPQFDWSPRTNQG